MYELEDGLKWFFDQVLEVLFNLLCALNIEETDKHAAETVHVLALSHFFIFNLFLDQPHVAAHTAHIGIHFHAAIHLENSVRIGPHTNIKKNSVLWLELLAKSVEKPVVRGQLACLLVLDAKK